MYISKIYILFTAEILLVLLAASISLIIYILKRPRQTKSDDNNDDHEFEDIDDIDITGTSYLEFLEHELVRNQTKASHPEANENTNTDTGSAELTEAKDDNSDVEQDTMTLLKLRELFLETEKTANQQSDNEPLFWEKIYSGMQNILEKFNSEANTLIIDAKQSQEKVFYIETQGKKVDTEVNKLKDIIYDQENALSSLMKALKNTEPHLSEDSVLYQELEQQLTQLQQQLNDSKMCMDVLDLENQRLQEEIDKLENKGSVEDLASDSADNIALLKETMETQSQHIGDLNQTIAELKLSAEEAERLQSTITQFTQNSKEMMNCIATLEDENENLHDKIRHLENATASDELIEKVKSLEEEVIKKDVQYAQLQDEFSSMEHEYMAMYEKVHGDGSD